MDLYPNFKKKEKKGIKSKLHPDIILKDQLNEEKKEKMKYTPDCVFCNYKSKPEKKKSKNKKKKK
jgi:hypothetical protein